MGKKFVLLFGFFVIVLWIVMGKTENNQQIAVNPQVNYRAPNFILPTLDKRELSLESFQGNPVLINFWASWCPPCRMETPDLMALYQKYGDRIGFIGINVTNQDDVENVYDFVKQYQVTFPIALDHSGEVSRQYKLLAMPTSYVLDQHGVIVFKKTGIVTKPEIEQVFEQLLKGDE